MRDTTTATTKKKTVAKALSGSLRFRPALFQSCCQQRLMVVVASPQNFESDVPEETALPDKEEAPFMTDSAARDGFMEAAASSSKFPQRLLLRPRPSSFSSRAATTGYVAPRSRLPMVAAAAEKEESVSVLKLRNSFQRLMRASTTTTTNKARPLRLVKSRDGRRFAPTTPALRAGQEENLSPRRPPAMEQERQDCPATPNPIRQRSDQMVLSPPTIARMTSFASRSSRKSVALPSSLFLPKEL